MSERTVIGKNVWLYVRTGPSTVIPIKCLTTHTITGSQEVSTTDTKCGRLKTAQGDPDFQVTGEGQVMLFTGGDGATNYSAGALFDALTAKQQIEWVSAPDGTPVEGDETFSGIGLFSEWEITYPAGEESTYSFTIEVIGTPEREVTPATT